MLLRDFMDASYALVMEDHTRINPLQGLESLAEKIISPSARVEHVPKPAEVKAQNESSMAALQAMLGNVQNAPMRKPRKTR